MLYPSVSNYINQKHQTSVITNYKKAIDEVSEERCAEELEKAREYNKRLPSLLSSDEIVTIHNSPEYLNILDISGNGVMGSIDIDKINVHLPIYHGTSNNVLQVGAGHMPETSLPVGGESTHCIISAHTGLPSAKLFTDLDKLETGDIFMINVLNEELAYKVDQIKVIEPYETDNMRIVGGKDYVTLVTCTPYGVNSHRLLVRGERITLEEAELAAAFFENDGAFVDKALLIPFVVVPVDIIYMMIIFSKSGKKPKRRSGKK